MTGALPISKTQARQVAEWMLDSFDTKLATAIQGTVFQKEHLCGIVCQETAYKWLSWLDQGMSTNDILGRCVFDASGDVPGTTRSAFPENGAAFRERYGDELTDILIREANLTRALQKGYGPKQWLYKGYGLFQYDLQNVLSDEAFFRERQWYSFDACLDRAMSELKAKYKTTGDLWKAIRAYNGSGPKANQYRQNVQVFSELCAEVAGVSARPTIAAADTTKVASGEG